MKILELAEFFDECPQKNLYIGFNDKIEWKKDA